MASLLGLFSLEARADVLVYGADHLQRLEDVVANLEGSGVDLGAVDHLAARTEHLSAETVAEYDAILTWDVVPYASGIVTGNVLADYSDEGGGVVVAHHGLIDSALGGVRGRFADEGYLPTTQGRHADPVARSMVITAPGHRIFDAVTSFSGGPSSAHATGIGIAPGAELLAEWSNEQILIAVMEPAGRTVAFNAYPWDTDTFHAGWDASTDGARLIANALLWSMGASCGDGYVEAEEACDDGNEVDTDDCLACVHATCGDGAVWAGVEACDDGNADDTDACANDCTIPSTGSSSSEDGGQPGTAGTGDPSDPSDPSGPGASSDTSGAPPVGPDDDSETTGAAVDEAETNGAGCGCRQGAGPSPLALFVMLLAARSSRTRPGSPRRSRACCSSHRSEDSQSETDCLA